MSGQDVVDRVSKHLSEIRCGQRGVADGIDPILDECNAITSSQVLRMWKNMTMILIVFEESWFDSPKGDCGLRGTLRPPCREKVRACEPGTGVTDEGNGNRLDSKPRVLLGNLGPRSSSSWDMRACLKGILPASPCHNRTCATIA